MLITAEANLSVRIGLYSCSSVEAIKEIPEIVTEHDKSLKIKGYTPMERFTMYLNDVLDEGDQNIAVSGWIDSEDDNQRKNLDLLAQDLLSSNSVGMIKYLDSAKIFFLHKNQILSKWTQPLGFEVKSLKRSSTSASLAFVLIYEPSKARSQIEELRKITPRSITPFQGATQSKAQTTAQSRSAGGLSSQIDDLLKPPTVNIKPEFLNMDSNSAHGEKNNNSRSGFSGFENRQQGYPSQSMVFDPYNEEPVYEEEFGFGNQFQNRQPRDFNQGRFSQENSRDLSAGRQFQKNYQQPQQQPFKRFNPQQQQGAKKFFKPTNAGGYQQRQSFGNQFTSNTQTQRQNTGFTAAPQYPSNYPKRQDSTQGAGYPQRNPRPFNPQNRVSTSRSPHDLGANPFYAEYLKKKGKTAGPQHMSISPAGRYPTPKNYNSQNPFTGAASPHNTNKLLQEDDRSLSPIAGNTFTKISKGPQQRSQNFKFSTHQAHKENARATYLSQTSYAPSRSNSNTFSNKTYSQTYSANFRR